MLPPESDLAVGYDALPSLEALEAAVARGAKIKVIGTPAGTSTLDFLLPVATKITRLSVTSARVEDVSVVEQMTSLVELHLDPTAKLKPVDLRGLSRLETFSGNQGYAESVLDLTSLRDLQLEVRDSSVVERLGSPLQVLSLSVPRRDTGVPRLSTPEELRDLSWSGGRTVDLRHLSRFSHLRHLTIWDVRQIEGAHALLELPMLESLSLGRIGAVDDLDSILALGRRRVAVDVEGRGGISPLLRASPLSRDWAFS